MPMSKGSEAKTLSVLETSCISKRDGGTASPGTKQEVSIFSKVCSHVAVLGRRTIS